MFYLSRGRSEYASSYYIHGMKLWTKRRGCALPRRIRRLRTLAHQKKTSTHWPTESPTVTKHKVVLIPFPFDDLSGMKVRPAVCLTDPIGTHRHVVLAFITSSGTSKLPTDIVLDSGDTEFCSTGLRTTSTLQLHRLMTVTTSLIRRQLGTLSPGMQAKVTERLRTLFALH